MITGSEGVSFLLPQLFLSQHRLKQTRFFISIMDIPSSMHIIDNDIKNVIGVDSACLILFHFHILTLIFIFQFSEISQITIYK